jgi:hypothetical protein
MRVAVGVDGVVVTYVAVGMTVVGRVAVGNAGMGEAVHAAEPTISIIHIIQRAARTSPFIA